MAQVSFLVLMLLPSVERYLAREVMVVVATVPELRDGQNTTGGTLTAPAVTFCPYNDSM